MTRSLSSPSFSVTPVDIHPAWDEVQRMDEFHVAASDNPVEKALRQWWNEVGHWLDERWTDFWDFIRQFFPNLDHVPKVDVAAPVALFMKYVLIAVAGLLVLLILFFVLRYLKVRWDGRRPATPMTPVRIVDGELLSSSRLHWDEAMALAQKKDYEAAVRQLYLASLCVMDETETVPFEENRTNLEYLRYIRALPLSCGKDAAGLDAEFYHVATIFERIRYGRGQCDTSGFEACLARCEHLVAITKGYAQKKQQEGQR